MIEDLLYELDRMLRKTSLKEVAAIVAIGVVLALVFG